MTCLDAPALPVRPPVVSARRAKAGLIWLLLGGLLALLGLAATAPHARADDPNEVEVTFTTVTPDVVPTAGDARITISGVVKNTSKRPMTGVQVSFWRSKDPILASADLDQVLASPWDAPIGERMGTEGTEPDQNLFNLTNASSPSFAPGASAPFTVSARVDQLQLGSRQGARLVGVHVRGTPRGERNYTVGRGRVLMPMVAPAPTTAQASIVVLASRPSLVGPTTFNDEHLVSELKGPLGRDLASAERTGATVMVDPALIDELEVVARDQGYQLTTGERTTRGRAEAQAWLDRFERLLSTHEVYRLPYGNPDLALALQAQQPAVVSRAATALGPQHRLARLPLAVMPARSVDQSFAAFVAPLRPRLIVFNGIDGPTKQVSGELTLVRISPSLAGGGPGPAPSRSAAQITGRALSQLVLNPTSSVVTLAGQIGPAQPAIDRSTTLMPIRGLPLTPGPVVWPGSVQIGGPDPAWWAALDRLQQRIIDDAALSGEVASGQQWAAQVTARGASQGFTPASANVFVRAAGALLRQPGRQNVQIISATTFVVNAPKTDLPLTVVNNSDRPVAVKVAFQSENAQRIDVPQTAVQVIPAHASRPFTFTVHARTNGALTVRARLLTSTNVAVGNEHRFTVTATSFGKVAWVILIASGVVVLGATALRIRQVRAERARLAATRVSTVAEQYQTPTDLGTRPHP